MEFKEASRPEDNQSLLTRSIKLYRLAFNKTIGLALLLSVVAFLPRLIGFVKGRNVYEIVPLINPNPWLFVLIDIVCLILFITILERIEVSIERKRDRLRKDFVLSLKKFPLVLLAVIIENVLFILLFLTFIGIYLLVQQFNTAFNTNPMALYLFILPFILQVFIVVYLFFSFIFYIPLIVTENFGVVQSLVYSFKLVWGNWFRVFKLQITPWACYVALLLMLRYGANINLHIYYAPHLSTDLLSVMVHMLVLAMFIPWFASVMLIQLHDVERRFELHKVPKHVKPKKKIAAKKR